MAEDDEAGIAEEGGLEDGGAGGNWFLTAKAGGGRRLLRKDRGRWLRKRTDEEAHLLGKEGPATVRAGERER